MTLRSTLRDLAPPLLLRTARKVLRRGLRFEGDYASWDEARSASRGYDQENIARRVLEAELKVKRGEAADARDGVTFDVIQFSLPAMAGLMRARRGDVLTVVDFGGALGGLYRHYKALGLPGRVRWTVVEQPRLAALGAAHFQNDELQFVESLDAALADGPDAVLLSSVLQYLPQPHAVAGRIAASAARHVIIDRTPCSTLDRDVLAVQKVPPEIYPASYPCWILSRQRLLEAFAPGLRLLAAFTDGTGAWKSDATAFQLAGFLLERSPQGGA
jgi:putative methyltransferase (TIGR04325 family)